MVPVLAVEPVFAVIEYETVPFPVPLASEVTVINESLLTTV